MRKALGLSAGGAAPSLARAAPCFASPAGASPISILKLHHRRRHIQFLGQLPHLLHGVRRAADRQAVGHGIGGDRYVQGRPAFRRSPRRAVQFPFLAEQLAHGLADARSWCPLETINQPCMVRAAFQHRQRLARHGWLRRLTVAQRANFFSNPHSRREAARGSRRRLGRRWGRGGRRFLLHGGGIGRGTALRGRGTLLLRIAPADAIRTQNKSERSHESDRKSKHDWSPSVMSTETTFCVSSHDRKAARIALAGPGRRLKAVNEQSPNRQSTPEEARQQ